MPVDRVKGKDLRLFPSESLKYAPKGARIVHVTGESRTMCSLATTDEWRGTGSQEEYETARNLKACQKCRAGRG